MKNIVAAPVGFIPRQNWPEFNLPAQMPQFMKPEAIAGDPSGVRWRFWPFFFEEYTSDTEPIVTTWEKTRGYLRIIKWHRLSRTDTPAGWKRFFKRSYVAIGFAELSADYSSSWSKVARYDRRYWLELVSEGSYRIRPLSWNEFKVVYPKSVVGRKVGTVSIDALDGVVSAGGGAFVECYVVVGKTNEILAGIAVLNSPTCKSSYYSAGFFMAGTEKLPLMTGLMDHWFQISQSRGFRVVQFGNFWVPGNPSSWKGFSQFKAKFGPKIVLYQPLLFRMMLG